MAKIYQRRYLKCPYNRARDLLADAVQQAAESREKRQLRLTFGVPALSSAEITKDVTVAVSTAVDPNHFDQPWQLHWEPVSGPYPSFDGTLTIRADEDYTTSILELQGNYKPPLGALGAAFDSMLGSRVAHETARELLQSIGERIEAKYNSEEAAKAVASIEIT
ncbi:MAG: hypothetical protein WBD74_08395 [Candidatus Aquilonibacter sp.]